MNQNSYLSTGSIGQNNFKINGLPFNSQVLMQKDLDIAVRINSAEQSHPITFSCLLPKGSNSNRLKVLFTSNDDLFFLYTLEITKQSIFSLNDEFSLKLQSLNDFLAMFKQLLDEIQNNTKTACLKFSNQNTLTLEILNVINGKQFLILSLIAEKQDHQVIQSWTAFKYGEMRQQIKNREQRIIQLKQLVRVKNPYLLSYFDKIQ